MTTLVTVSVDWAVVGGADEPNVNMVPGVFVVV